MQTTLLSIGIAIILALMAALIGPVLVDWGDYRSAIETEASQMVGAPVRVGGTIDVRILPTPSLKLGDVQIGPAASAEKVTVGELAMEFGLGTLMRGEFRASQVTLDRPEIRVGLDGSGALQAPGLNIRFDPDRIAIERLIINDGKLLLADAASGGEIAVEQLSLAGEVGSLIGPFKAEGAFAAKGERFAYRLSGGRRGDDGGMKVRLAIDPAERALAFESDGTVFIEGGAPRFEGAATLSRVVGTALPGGRVAINDPWKASAKIKATSKTMLADQLELLYGPESRLIRLNGSAIVTFGRDPRIASTLTARQIDLDRVLPNSELKRLPFETVKLLANELTTVPPPPIPIRVSLGIDSLMAGGATLSALRGEVENTADGWQLDTLEMRAPGATQVLVSGKLALADRKVEFRGPVKVDSSDPAALFAWIEGRSAAGRPALGPMRGSGAITLGPERIAVDQLKAEIDRKALEGRVAYRFATAAAPARLDAALSGAELDFDRALALGSALFASTSFERPGEIALALDIGHASYAGIEARKAQAALTYDQSGLKIERLSIGDIGGASIDASGRLDNTADAWRGSLSMALAAPRLDGITALADRFWPRTSDALHKYGARIAPFKVNAKLDMEPRTGDQTGAGTVTRLKADGTIAGINISLDGSAAGDISDPAAAVMHIGGRLDAPDGRALASLIGIDALATADSRPARITFVADGVPNGALRVGGAFAGADLNASTTGTMTLSGDGTLDVTFRAANTKLPRRAGSPAVPADLRARLAIDGREVAVTDLSGKIAGAAVKGSLMISLGEPLRVNGRIEADQVDAGELAAIATGAPRAAPGVRSPEWVAEPFGPPMAPAAEGRVEFKAANAQWMTGVAAKDVAGWVRFEPSGFSLADVTARVADGRLALDADIRREGASLAVRSHVKLTNADMPVLLAGALRAPAAGRVSLEADLQGQGLSPASLVGSLTGAGTATAENIEVSGLDPAAIDAVLNALEADRSLASNSPRVTQIANGLLDAGKLKIPFATAPIVIADGRAQLPKVSASSAQKTDISGSMSLALADWQFDARFAMTAPPRKNAPAAAERPVMTVTIRGPLTGARRSVDVSGLIGWATMRAVDEEAKRLDEAEKERKRLEAVDALRRQSDTGTGAPAQPPPLRAGEGREGASAPAAAFDRRTRPGAYGSAPDR
ncbi:MAG TPA: AsmA family protein [Xanthobacteraceae bacterium]|nr:AsmA family protein [Xanthobacteraceae bacterium]